MKHLRCAICRETTTLHEIAYVDAHASVEENPDSISVRVKGSHSTKVQAVVQQLLLIKKDDPNAKCLLFSTVNNYLFDFWIILGTKFDIIFCFFPVG